MIRQRISVFLVCSAIVSATLYMLYILAENINISVCWFFWWIDFVMVILWYVAIIIISITLYIEEKKKKTHKDTEE